MARIEITVPGERVVEDFTALVQRTITPSTAKPADIGLVEISQSTPTELIPGPVGPQGPRGSRWYTGVGDPTVTGALLGDMYLDDVSGDIWTWDGTAWVNTGTNLSPSGQQLLDEILLVDGAGSTLDADLLDGQDGAYYLDWDNFTDKPATFPPTLPIAQSGVTNLVSDLALKAPLASPLFTGDPRAPTPATSDNDTSVATTAYVKANLAGVVQFPEAPNDGLTYGRKSLAWATIVGGAVVSDTAPGAPLQNGQLWFKSDEGNTYIWVTDANSSQWVMQNVLPPAEDIPLTGIVQTVVTSSGTYTKPAGLRYLEVEGVGGGGGCPQNVTAAAGQGSASSGGGSGAYGKRLFAASELSASTPYTVGAAGAGGALTTGGTGGTSEFGSGLNCTLAGGVGGTRNASLATFSPLSGGAGGTAGSGWTVGVVGMQADQSVSCFVGSGSSIGYRGAGGQTPFSNATPVSGWFGGASVTSLPSVGYGGGAGGQTAFAGAGSPGADGKQGILIFTEYF